MAPSFHLLFRTCFFVLVAVTTAHAETSQNLVQSLVVQYEKLPVAERIAFLQTIALIGAQSSATTLLTSKTNAQGYTDTDIKPTAPVVALLPERFEREPNTNDIKLTPILSPMAEVDEIQAEALSSVLAPEQIAHAKNKYKIWLITKHNSPAAPLDNSVFYLLLDNYNQKITDPLKKIEARDLRNEAVFFYVDRLKQQLSNCGYDVASGEQQPEESWTDFELETDLARIVVNKTLLETAVTGEAIAQISQFNPDSNQHEVRTIKHARAAKSISESGDTSERDNELKLALGTVISQLSDQIAEKICSTKA